MELNINSPAYYKNIFGVDNDIYQMCRKLSIFMKDKSYSDIISLVGICPIIAPQQELDKGLWKETKKCELKYGFASVSLQIDYDTYVKADINKKKQLMINNILKSVKVISKRGKIDYKQFEEDVKQYCRTHLIEIA